MTAVTAGLGGGGGQGATAGVLGLPGGQFIVGAVGIGILVTGIVTVVRGVQKKFLEDMTLPADRTARVTAVRVGQVGYGVFCFFDARYHRV